MPASPRMPSRLLYVHNEYSSHAERTEQSMDAAQAAGWTVGEVVTDRRLSVTQDRIAGAIRPEDALVASGGDGTVNAVINAAYTLGLLGHYILAEKAGNACDSARNLHGDVPLLETLERGRPVAAYALRTMVEYESGDMRTKYAAGYAGVGGAGEASVRLDRVKQWPFHTVVEPFTAWKAVGRHPYFKLHDTHRSADAPERVTDVSVAIGDIIAKYGHTGADIFSAEARMIYTRRRGMAAALLQMLKLRSGKLESEAVTRPVRIKIETTDPAGILTMYHDGETMGIPSGSNITFGVEPRPYWTLRSARA
jgi:hypothetical protein